MIWESSYWKDKLKKQSAELKKRMAQRRWRDVSLARCEQTIMIGFYSVRKLIESKKLTDAVSKSAHKIRCYKSTGKPITLFTRHNLDELYDLENPRQRTKQLTYLCHQVIHSYVFSLVFGEDRMLSAIFVTSDRSRFKELIEISLPQIVELFDKVSDDDPFSTIFKFEALVHKSG